MIKATKKRLSFCRLIKLLGKSHGERLQPRNPHKVPPKVGERSPGRLFFSDCVTFTDHLLQKSSISISINPPQFLFGEFLKKYLAPIPFTQWHVHFYLLTVRPHPENRPCQKEAGSSSNTSMIRCIRWYVTFREGFFELKFYNLHLLSPQNPTEMI